MIALSLVPAFGTLYQRLTLRESSRFINAQKQNAVEEDEDDIDKLKRQQRASEEAEMKDLSKTPETTTTTTNSEEPEAEEVAKKPAHFKGMLACLPI